MLVIIFVNEAYVEGGEKREGEGNEGRERDRGKEGGRERGRERVLVFKA